MQQPPLSALPSPTTASIRPILPAQPAQPTLPADAGLSGGEAAAAFGVTLSKRNHGSNLSSSDGVVPAISAAARAAEAAACDEAVATAAADAAAKVRAAAEARLAKARSGLSSAADTPRKATTRVIASSCRASSSAQQPSTPVRAAALGGSRHGESSGTDRQSDGASEKPTPASALVVAASDEPPVVATANEPLVVTTNEPLAVTYEPPSVYDVAYFESAHCARPLDDVLPADFVPPPSPAEVELLLELAASMDDAESEAAQQLDGIAGGQKLMTDSSMIERARAALEAPRAGVLCSTDRAHQDEYHMDMEIAREYLGARELEAARSGTESEIAALIARALSQATASEAVRSALPPRTIASAEAPSRLVPPEDGVTTSHDASTPEAVPRPAVATPSAGAAQPLGQASSGSLLSRRLQHATASTSCLIYQRPVHSSKREPPPRVVRTPTSGKDLVTPLEPLSVRSIEDELQALLEKQQERQQQQLALLEAQYYMHHGGEEGLLLDATPRHPPAAHRPRDVPVDAKRGGSGDAKGGGGGGGDAEVDDLGEAQGLLRYVYSTLSSAIEDSVLAPSSETTAAAPSQRFGFAGSADALTYIGELVGTPPPSDAPGGVRDGNPPGRTASWSEHLALLFMGTFPERLINEGVQTPAPDEAHAGGSEAAAKPPAEGYVEPVDELIELAGQIGGRMSARLTQLEMPRQLGALYESLGGTPDGMDKLMREMASSTDDLDADIDAMMQDDGFAMMEDPYDDDYAADGGPVNISFGADSAVYMARATGQDAKTETFWL